MHELATRPGGAIEWLLKLRRYQHQQEYRFVWNTQTQPDKHITVKVPDARHFCSRITESVVPPKMPM